MTDLDYRVLSLSFKHKLAHIGSCLGAAPILDEIYSKRQPADPVCLANAHAGVALYAVLEKWLGVDAEMMLEKHGIHSTRDKENGIYVSGGSLGQVETVAIGLALADRSRDVWLLSSDGGTAEGSFWEALAFKADHKLTNLRWYVIANGYGAYREIDSSTLAKRIHAFDSDVTIVTIKPSPWDGLAAHYNILTDDDFKRIAKQ